MTAKLHPWCICMQTMHAASCWDTGSHDYSTALFHVCMQTMCAASGWHSGIACAGEGRLWAAAGPEQARVAVGPAGQPSIRRLGGRPAHPALYPPAVMRPYRANVCITYGVCTSRSCMAGHDTI